MRGLGPGLIVFALALGLYLLNGRFDESTDTSGNELLPICILQWHSLTFDQYYTERGRQISKAR